jgi:hypothetical protein
LQLAQKDKWLVRLGRSEWLRFTYDRPPGDPLTLLGSIRRGMRFGALGINDKGEYVQVNGDHVSSLNASQVRNALRGVLGPEEPAPPPKPGPEHTPVIVVKRRRIIQR